MRPDAAFNSSVPVALAVAAPLQRGASSWAAQLSSAQLTAAAAAHPGSHESRVRLVPRGRGGERKLC